MYIQMNRGEQLRGMQGVSPNFLALLNPDLPEEAIVHIIRYLFLIKPTLHEACDIPPGG